MKALIIVGSSRNDGNTLNAVLCLQKLTGFDSIDLSDFEVSYYDYKNANQSDSYLPLIRSIIEKYDTLIFATPVYWYAMSGIMKVFFDRFTDLLTLEKELGRKLRGKNMAALSSSGGDNLGDSFWLPFRETARYLGMNYLGDVHIVGEKEMEKNLNVFCDQIEREYQKHNALK